MSEHTGRAAELIVAVRQARGERSLWAREREEWAKAREEHGRKPR